METQLPQKAHADSSCWNHSCELPYSLTISEIQRALDSLYDILYSFNKTLFDNGFEPFEKMALGNTFSGLLSEILVKNIARHSTAVVRNIRVGGHPDLIPANHSGGNNQLRCKDGIEIKTSRQRGGWQGHNPEGGWLMVFRYKLADSRNPTRFVQILAANLTAGDWSLAERGSESRRTRTCSIKESGMHKLRMNPVYQEKDHIVAPNASLRIKYQALHERFQEG